MKKHLKRTWGGYAFFLVLALVLIAALVWRASTVAWPSTAVQAKEGCRDHGGVRAITDPGATGAYVVCLDGKQAFHTHTGRHSK